MQVLLLLKNYQHWRFLCNNGDNLDCSIIPNDKNVSCIPSDGYLANRALPNGSLQAEERSVFLSVDFAERRSVDLAECKSSLRLAFAGQTKRLAQAHRASPKARPVGGPRSVLDIAKRCPASSKRLLPQSLAIRLPAGAWPRSAWPGCQSADLCSEALGAIFQQSFL